VNRLDQFMTNPRKYLERMNVSSDELDRASQFQFSRNFTSILVCIDGIVEIHQLGHSLNQLYVGVTLMTLINMLFNPWIE